MLQNGLTMLGRPEIKLLNILKIMCVVIGSLHESRKFDSETTEALNNPSCRTNKAPHIKTYKLDANDINANMPDYFRSSINSRKKRASEVLMNKIHIEFSHAFIGMGFFKGVVSLQVKDGSQPYQAPPKRVCFVLQAHLKEELEGL